MKRTYRFIPILLLSILITACGTQAQSPPSKEQQIAGAVAPAPEDMREGATVLGYDSNMELVTLREGDNELICLADDPRDDRYHAACYHESLEPFMKIGRDMRARGMSRTAVDSVRQARIEAGELQMPDRPAALYSLTGEEGSFDPATGEVSGATPLYVVYAPFETGETTGLPTEPHGSMPWLMEAGQPWAHIMISPGSGK